MNTMRTPTLSGAKSIALIATLCSLLAIPAFAEAPILGSNGEIFQLQLGLKSAILPASQGPDTHLAVLEISRRDGSTERFVVPGTGQGQDIESAATVLFEPATETLFIVWESRVNFIHSVLKMVSFDGTAWSDVISLRGGWVTPRSTPTIAITRGEYPSLDGSTSVHRTILHMTWWESTPDGDEVLYAPIILENGGFVEVQDSLVLAQVPTVGEADPAFGLVSEALLHSPDIRPARDADSVIIGFADAGSGLFRTVEVHAIPGQLSGFADRLRSRIVEFSTTELQPLQRAELAWSEISLLGANLHPSVRDYIARGVFDYLVDSESPQDNPELLAEGVRRLVIEIGDSATGGSLMSFNDALRSRIVEFDSHSGERQTPSHVFTVRPTSERAAPLTPEAPTSLYLSPTGQQALVAWEEEGGISYIETTADGWTEGVTLRFGASLTQAIARQILSERANNL
jgi:hypothetical protein